MRNVILTCILAFFSSLAWATDTVTDSPAKQTSSTGVIIIGIILIVVIIAVLYRRQRRKFNH